MAYRIMAVNDEEDTCSICGRTNLKQVAWVVEFDADGNAVSDASPVGTTCAAKLARIRTATKTVRDFDYMKRNIIDAARARHPLNKRNNEIIKEWNRQGLLFLARKATPEMAELTANEAIIREAASKEFQGVELA